MNNLITILISCVAMAFLMAPVAFAQTPDGSTPDKEHVCDALASDDITKGLYGLCVAFCEATDSASLYMPVTEAELEALRGQAPSGRILDNYNNKKKEGDPDMPCILVQEPCPCFSAEELRSIDGIAPDGTSMRFFCDTSHPDGSGYYRGIRLRENSPDHYATAHALPPANFYRCDYVNEQVSPRFLRILESRQRTLTIEQGEACVAQLNAVCDANGL
jgi:hypothetical protein